VRRPTILQRVPKFGKLDACKIQGLIFLYLSESLDKEGEIQVLSGDESRG